MESIWWEKSNMPKFPALERDISTQVLVIGGGLAGLLCAYRLSKQGVDCILIEADRIFSGNSGRSSAKITSQHGLLYHSLIKRFGAKTAKLYWQFNQQALEEYRALSRELDFDFEEKNNYIFDSTDPQKVVRELNALKELEIPAAFIKPLPIPTGSGGGICFAHQGQMNPVKLAAEVARGLRIFEYTPAREIQDNQVQTDRGRIHAEQIVVATHFPILRIKGLYPLKLYQHRSYMLAISGAEDVNGMYLDCAPEGISLRNSGSVLLLGGGGHRTGKPGSGWRKLEAFAAKEYPQGKIIAKWAAQDCMSLDGMPYIGPYSSETDNIFVATGFNKWGMTGSMAASGILSDLITGNDNPYAWITSPSRSILWPQLGANGLEAVKSLLTIRKPRCPHLGCALQWNPWEHSWDCPCHGSRFAEDGTLLDNPANKDL